MLNVYTYQVVFKEIPDKITLAFSITGCGGPCKYCHSPFLHEKVNGDEMDLATFERIISPYVNQVEVILFLGGEWEEDLSDYLKLATSLGFKVALYTEKYLEDLSEDIINKLDYLKVGPYIKELGGLDSVTTNQKLYEIVDNEFKDITSKFLKVRKEGF